jgi:hypothetical protein
MRHRQKFKKRPDDDATYFCITGLSSKNVIFVKDLKWKDIHRGPETDFETIVTYLRQEAEKERERGRKRKRELLTFQLVMLLLALSNIERRSGKRRRTV